MRKEMILRVLSFVFLVFNIVFLRIELTFAQTPIAREYFTFHNLVRNGSFESFDQTQGIPAEWGITDPNQVSLLSDPSQVKVGAVSLNLSGPVKFTQEIRDWKGLEASNVTLGAWIKGSSGDNLKFYVDDGVNRQEKAVSLTDAQWKFVTFKTTAINASAQSLKIEVEVVSTATGISLDGVMLSQVTKGVAFVPNPDDQEKSPQDLIYTDTVSGNVGIGTNTPQTALDVLGDIRASGKVYQGESEQQEELLTKTVADEVYLNNDQDETLTGNLTVTGNVSAAGQVISEMFPLLTKTEAEGAYVKKAGDTILGDLIVNGDIKTFLISSGSSAGGLSLYSGNGRDSYIWDAGIQMYGSSNPDYPGDAFFDANNLSFRSLINNGYTTKMIINRSGNVGIGTTEPIHKLEIAGNNNPSTNIGTLFIGGSGYDSNQAKIALSPDGTGNSSGIISVYRDTTAEHFSRLNFGFNDVGETLMTVKSNGNVGIGTTNPMHALQIGGSPLTNTGTFFIGGSGYNSNQAKIALSPDGTGNSSGIISVYRDTTAEHFSRLNFGFNDGGNETLMTVKSNGNVGIGTTSPTVNLEVYGNNPRMIISQNPAIPGNASLLIGAAGNDNTASIQLIGAVIQSNTAGNGALLLNPSSSGNVGIGRTDAQYKLDVSGDIRLTGNIIPDGDICIGRCN